MEEVFPLQVNGLGRLERPSRAACARALAMERNVGLRLKFDAATRGSVFRYHECVARMDAIVQLIQMVGSVAVSIRKRVASLDRSTLPMNGYCLFRYMVWRTGTAIHQSLKIEYVLTPVGPGSPFWN